MCVNVFYEHLNDAKFKDHNMHKSLWPASNPVFVCAYFDLSSPVKELVHSMACSLMYYMVFSHIFSCDFFLLLNFFSFFVEFFLSC